MVKWGSEQASKDVHSEREDAVARIVGKPASISLLFPCSPFHGEGPASGTLKGPQLVAATRR